MRNHTFRFKPSRIKEFRELREKISGPKKEEEQEGEQTIFTSGRKPVSGTRQTRTRRGRDVDTGGEY